MPGTVRRLERQAARLCPHGVHILGKRSITKYNPIKAKKKPSFGVTYRGAHLVLKKDFSKEVVFEKRADG